MGEQHKLRTCHPSARGPCAKRCILLLERLLDRIPVVQHRAARCADQPVIWGTVECVCVRVVGGFAFSVGNNLGRSGCGCARQNGQSLMPEVRGSLWAGRYSSPQRRKPTLRRGAAGWRGCPCCELEPAGQDDLKADKGFGSSSARLFISNPWVLRPEGRRMGSTARHIHLSLAGTDVLYGHGPDYAQIIF